MIRWGRGGREREGEMGRGAVLAFGEEKGPEIIAALARRDGAQPMTCGTRVFGPHSSVTSGRVPKWIK